MTFSVTVEHTLATGEGELHWCDTCQVEAPNERVARRLAGADEITDHVTRVQRKN